MENPLLQLPVKRHLRAKNKSHKIKPTYPTSSAIIAAKLIIQLNRLL